MPTYSYLCLFRMIGIEIETQDPFREQFVPYYLKTRAGNQCHTLKCRVSICPLQRKDSIAALIHGFMYIYVRSGGRRAGDSPVEILFDGRRRKRLGCCPNLLIRKRVAVPSYRKKPARVSCNLSVSQILGGKSGRHEGSNNHSLTNYTKTENKKPNFFVFRCIFSVGFRRKKH